MWTPATGGVWTVVPGWEVRSTWPPRRAASRARAAAGGPGPVGGGGGGQGVRRSADKHGAVGDDRVGRDEGALAEDAAVAQPGAGHEDGPVAYLAQVPDPGADDGGAVAEDGALADLDRLSGPADQHPVLQHRGVVAQSDVAGAGAQHDSLGEQGPGAQVRLPDQDRRRGDLGGWLLGTG